MNKIIPVGIMFVIFLLLITITYAITITPGVYLEPSNVDVSYTISPDLNLNEVIVESDHIKIDSMKVYLNPSSGLINVTILNWDNSYKKWNISTNDPSITVNHIIGNFTAGAEITIKRNGVDWKTIIVDSENQISFIYDEGFSEVQLEVVDPGACVESWSCSEWSECIDKLQTRTCTDENDCGTTIYKPSESQECQSCVESWLCSDWSDCVDKLQTRNCSDQNDCGTIEYKPNETQECGEIKEIEQIEDILPQIISAAPTYYSGVSSGGAAGPGGLALSGGKVETETKPQVRIFGPMSFDYDLPIHRIDLTPLKDITSSKIILEDKGTITPKEMTPPNAIVYRYLDLDKMNIQKDDVSNIKISFKVEQSFYERYDLDLSQTKLMRYNPISNEWDTLSTQRVSTLGDYHFFESTPNELSFYAITTLPTGAVGLGLPLTWVVVIIIVIVFIIIVIFKRR